jgi:AbrB family looped-hinge helix DNA binding protein
MPRRGFAEEQQPFQPEQDELRSISHVRLKIDSAGRVVIPAEMRAAMMVKPGDTVTAEVVDGVFRIISPDVALKRFRAVGREWQKKNPGVDLVEELIAGRREEARKELEETNAWRVAHGLPPLE